MHHNQKKTMKKKNEKTVRERPPSFREEDRAAGGAVELKNAKAMEAMVMGRANDDGKTGVRGQPHDLSFR